MSMEARAGLSSGATPAAAIQMRVKAWQSERLQSLGLLVLALLLGLLVRASVVGAGENFPLNDGGMFYAMVEDIKASSYRLPDHTSYNGGDIPFAYPSLPFYLGAAVSDLTGWSTLDVLIVLPFCFSLLTILAFYALARAMLATERMASLAVLVFAVIPRSFNWEIVGGGLTRSPGFFFALLTLWQGYLLFTTPRRLHLLTTSVLSALTFLCHMEMGWFVAFSLLLFVVSRGRQRENLIKALVLGPSVLLLTAPWWLETILRVGLDPMLSALGSSGHSFWVPLRLLTLTFTEEPGFPIAIALGVLGVLSCIRDKQYLLPLWLVVIFVFDARKPATISTAPLAMLAAYGLVEVFWPLVRDSVARLSGARRAPVWGSFIVGFALVLYAPFAAIGSSAEERSPLYSLSEGNREAMEWVRTNTPQGAKFIVMPSTSGWGWDAASEWFPALTGRVSLATVQGSEWLGASTYKQRQENFKALINCTSQGVNCLESWARTAELDYDYVYVAKGHPVISEKSLLGRKRDCCAEFRSSMAGSANYVQVFDGPGATVFARK